jgi:hypothetical protein
MAVDAAGHVHFVGVTRQRLVYWTNANGAWEHENLGSPVDGLISDKNPGLAITDSGDVVVAYERSWCFVLGCDSAVINVTIKTSAGWSAPHEVAPGVAPSLATAAGGVIGLAYEATSGFTDVACEAPTPIDYAVLVGGGWDVTRVTNDGRYPRLALGPQGAPYVVFTNECGPIGNAAGLHIAELKADGDSFGREPVPGTSPVESVAHSIAVDSAGGVHLLYERYNDDDEAEFVYSVRTGTGWTEPVAPLPGRSPRWLSLTDAGVAHFLGDSSSDGWWHAAGSPAGIVVDPIVTDLRGDYLAAGALALDNAGRPHVLFTAGGGGGRPFSLWYGVLASP